VTEEQAGGLELDGKKKPIYRGVTERTDEFQRNKQKKEGAGTWGKTQGASNKRRENKESLKFKKAIRAGLMGGTYGYNHSWGKEICWE